MLTNGREKINYEFQKFLLVYTVTHKNGSLSTSLTKADSRLKYF